MRAIAALVVLVVVSSASTAATEAASPSSHPWPQHLVAPESLKVAAHLVSGHYLYQLVSKTLSPIRGPYQLERRDLRNGSIIKGSSFPVGNLALVAGELWINGASDSRPQLIEVDPRTLHVVRTISLPKAPTPYPFLSLSAGPGRSVWVGTSTTLLRIDLASGRSLTTVTVPRGFAAGYLATDPAGRHLYVSLTHSVSKGGLDGGALIEYAATSGQKLAEVTHGPITYSVAGAGLTAVPGGVWATFRTGMLGLTIHLRQSDLATIAPPGKAAIAGPANTLFHWPMDASTLYVGGSLWIANEAGFIACLDPQTAKVRASERISPFEAPTFIGADAGARELFFVGGGGRGVIELTPPPGCWR